MIKKSLEGKKNFMEHMRKEYDIDVADRILRRINKMGTKGYLKKNSY